MQYSNLILKQYGARNSQKSPLSCSIGREQKSLDVCFTLNDFVDKVIIPKQKTARATRQDDLWQMTCFELFLSSPGQKKYWEVNLSPNKNWNVYSFESYREGMQIENNIQDICILTEQDDNSLSLQTSLSLDRISLDNCPLQIGVSTVLEMTDKQKTYWALKHGQEKPDFHDRSSFILTL